MHKLFNMRTDFISIVIKICINCKLEKEHHAKGLCYSCYKKLNWNPKIKTCHRCKRKIAIHAKGLCASCYNLTFHLDKSRAYNQRKRNNIDIKTFRKVTQECVICGFSRIVDIHHIDTNNTNNTKKNLIGLCPNHHRMIHNSNFRLEIFVILKQKGYNIPLENNIINPKMDS